MIKKIYTENWISNLGQRRCIIFAFQNELNITISDQWAEATLVTHCKHWLLLLDCQMLPIKFTQQLHLMLLELVIVQELVILCTKCYM